MGKTSANVCGIYGNMVGYSVCACVCMRVFDRSSLLVLLLI